MRTIMAKTPHDSSFSFSRRYFHWKKKSDDDECDYSDASTKHYYYNHNDDGGRDNEEEILNTFTNSQFLSHQHKEESIHRQHHHPLPLKKKKSTVSKLLTLFKPGHHHHHRHHHCQSRQLGTKVVGTLFGHRRGHVHFAFQEEPGLSPAFLIELAMPTSVLVREMASGLVRIALECERPSHAPPGEKRRRLIEEPVWRTYCNGRKCGFASRAECGPDEWKVLRAVGPISMGAGVLPGSADGDSGGGGEAGEVMYMRARFERVVGSKDSEAFYMMNPDGSGGPELSIYLLRV